MVYYEDMRYQVPQFVDIEDKIIGPLTLKQFLMYVAAALLLVPVYLYSDLSLFISVAIPVVGTAALFAHFKVNGKSLAATLGFAFHYYSTGQLYVWRRGSKLTTILIKDREWEELHFARSEATQERSNLAATARTLDASGSIVGIDEADPLVTENS